MSHKVLQIHEGAVIIADAHYAPQRRELLGFLKAIENEELPASQLILMGDIFDLLFGGIPLTQERNREVIDTINSIALRIEVVYLEGNHDFRLAPIFPKVMVIPLEQQPCLGYYNDKKVMLAHGDFATDFGYRLYTGIIRSALVLKILNRINSLMNNGIIKWLDAYLQKKEDCNAFEGFEAYVQRRLKAIDLTGIDYFLEGHYHQNRGFLSGKTRYFNLAAFACNQRYFIVQSMESEAIVHEVIFKKES